MSTDGHNSSAEALIAEARNLRAAYLAGLASKGYALVAAAYGRYAQARADRAASRALADLDRHTRLDVGLEFAAPDLTIQAPANENRPRDVA